MPGPFFGGYLLIVQTAEEFNEALSFINQQETLAIDIETTGLNIRKDIIIGIGISNHLTGCYFPLYQYVRDSNKLLPIGIGAQLVNILLETLKRKNLLAFNAAFDLPFIKNTLKVDLLPALHTDVLLLKHTCDEDFPLGLKEIATKLWGTDVKKEKEEMQTSIKANGGTTTHYYKANMETLAKYCVQDCLLTFRLFTHYSRDLRKQGLESFFYTEEVMPLLKEVTIPMEAIGVKLNIPLMRQSLTEIDQDLLQLEISILDKIKPNLELFTSWFLNKDYPYKEKGRIAKLMKKFDLDVKGAQDLAWLQDNEENRPMFNLLSKHHLKKLFFDTLKETPLSTTEKGNPQVDEEFLEEMAKKYDWAAQLIVYNKLTKIKGTYIERMLEESEDGIFYPRFMQHRTISGRFGGDIQQLNRPLEPGMAHDLVVKHNNRIREFIIPRDGNYLIGADYEQLEPSIFAHTSGDSALQKIFKEDNDFYSEVAIRTERFVGVSSDKSSSAYLGKVNKVARQKAKAYALGIAYGMTGYKLQFEIGVEQEAAEKLVTDYLNAFPQLAKWMEQSKDKARYDGKVKSEAGRIRHLEQCKTLFERYGSQLADSLRLWKNYNNMPEMYSKMKQLRKEYINLCNNAINFQIQSLAASIMNRAMLKISRTLKQYNLKALLIMSVHDEVVLDCPKEEIEQVKDLVKTIMENIYPLTVPLRVVPIIGTNYRECK